MSRDRPHHPLPSPLFPRTVPAMGLAVVSYQPSSLKQNAGWLDEDHKAKQRPNREIWLPSIPVDPKNWVDLIGMLPKHVNNYYFFK